MPQPPDTDDGTKVILVGALANLILSGIKFAAGIVGNSAAMVADAVHSLSDLFSDGVVFFTYKIGKIPRDREHPYGHGRAENLGATAVGLVIILAGLGLLREAWEILQSEKFRVPSWIAAATALISIFSKEWLYRYTRDVGKKNYSPSIVANAWHHRTDAISSIAALLGIGAAIFGYPVMDPVAAGVVALMIVKVGYDVTLEGLRDLMDTSLSEEDLGKIRRAIDGIPEIREFHDLRTRKAGGDILMDVHILVHPDLTVTEGHNIAETLRRTLIKEFNQVQDVLVHVDAEDDSFVEGLYSVTRGELMRRIDPILQSIPGVAGRTGLRVHYLKGKMNLEIHLKVEHDISIEETRTIVRTLTSRLKTSAEIGTVKIYLDLNEN